MSRHVSAVSADGGGDDDEQVRDVSDAVHEIGGDPVQVLVREVARWEDVHRVKRLWGKFIYRYYIVVILIKCLHTDYTKTSDHYWMQSSKLYSRVTLVYVST